MAQQLSILYQDEYIIAVDKPSGLLSIGYPGFHGKTALDILCADYMKYGKQARRHSTKAHGATGTPRPAVVHRLDRDTSGVMLFAIGEESKKRLMDNWHTLVTERTYIALIECSESSSKRLSDSGTINAPLSYNAYNIAYVATGKSPRKAKQGAEPLYAVTHYKVLLRGKHYALVQFKLETGRKNQIRAHISYLGFPIAGDEAYRARTNPVKRLALHARTLAFTHPFTGEAMRFEVSESPMWAKLAR